MENKRAGAARKTPERENQEGHSPSLSPGLPWDLVEAQRAGRPGSHTQGPEAKATSWLSGEQFHSHSAMSTGFISLKTASFEKT